MGQVYKARDNRLERIVAIKILPDTLAADPQFRERFDREAKSVAALSHPHICAIYDVGHQDGTAYLVMEYLEGTTLAGRLDKEALPLDLALRYAIEISAALDAAHRAGFVHRDLKPGNIMLTPSGAKLLDFGLAKATMPLGASGQSMLSTTPATLTAQGTLLGTLQYMAPEQLEGGEADVRTDIFAFGAVLYEMLTGRKAFEAKSQASLIAAIIGGDPPSIVASQPVAPPSLDRLVKKCLAKDPAARWQTARDLHDELRWITEARSQPDVASQRLGAHHGVRQWATVGAMVAALVLAAFLGLAWWRARTPVDRPLMRFSAELRRDANAMLHLDDVEFTGTQPGGWLALSPDATRLALKAVRDQDGKSRLAIRRLDEAQFRTLAGTENATSPFFSPNGEWIAFFGDGQLRKIPVQGGAPVVLCSAENFATGSWGDDGNIVASLSHDGGLSRISATASCGTPTPLTQLREGELYHRWPQVLPGSVAVLFTASTGGGPEDSSIDILSLTTRERKTLVRGGALGRYVTSSDGHTYLVYVHQHTLLAVGFDARKLSVAGTPQPILNDVASTVATWPADFDVSNNGTFAYVSGRGEPERSMFWLDDAGRVEPLHPAPGFYNGMRFSPDGSRVAYAAGSVLGQGDLWIEDVQRNTSMRLTSLPGSSNSPVWSVDGKYIVFRVVNQPKAGIYVIRSDESGEPQLLAKVGFPEFPAAFSPNGSQLVLQSGNPFTAMEVTTAPFADTSDHPQLGHPELLLRARGFPMPAFSPDSHWIAYESGETGRTEVYVQPFPGSGGRVPISSEGGGFPVWSSSGHELFFIGPDRRIMVADYTANGRSFSPGKPRIWSRQQILMNDGGGPFQPYALAPDGKRFVVLLYPDGTSERRDSLHLTFLLNFGDELRRRIQSSR
jgi:serine/threonine-protein kinase